MTFNETQKEKLTADEQSVNKYLNVYGALHIDDIASGLHMSAAEANSVLVMLEIKGYARRLPENYFVSISKKTVGEAASSSRKNVA